MLGQIKGDPEVEALRSEFDALKGMMASIEQKLVGVERRLA